MKPNILLITADQWRGECLSAAGHACVKTPNVDALAAEGVLFRRHYAGAAPCSPARASLYTGLYQMNITLASLTPGEYPLVMTIDGVPTQTGLVLVVVQ